MCDCCSRKGQPLIPGQGVPQHGHDHGHDHGQGHHHHHGHDHGHDHGQGHHHHHDHGPVFTVIEAAPASLKTKS